MNDSNSNKSASSNALEVTVTELSGRLKKTVEDTFGHVRVRGEISGFRGPHSSGHCYFSLKDERARLEAVIWRGQAAKLKHMPEEGLEVIASGKLTTYPGSSKYQIVIDNLEPAGAGALMALLEERRRKLTAEGLFHDDRKQLLPFMPKVVGVITSPTGAGLSGTSCTASGTAFRFMSWFGPSGFRAKRPAKKLPMVFISSTICLWTAGCPDPI